LQLMMRRQSDQLHDIGATVTVPISPKILCYIRLRNRTHVSRDRGSEGGEESCGEERRGQVRSGQVRSGQVRANMQN
jgi:hypothetical protein